jgi:hypothetical protein
MASTFAIGRRRAPLLDAVVKFDPWSNVPMTHTESPDWLSLAAILAVIGALALAAGSQEVRITPRATHTAVLGATTNAEPARSAQTQRLFGMMRADRCGLGG